MTKSREETQAEWAKNMETVQKEHPEMDAKLDTAWWKPAADFSFDVKVCYRILFALHVDADAV